MHRMHCKETMTTSRKYTYCINITLTIIDKKIMSTRKTEHIQRTNISAVKDTYLVVLPMPSHPNSSDKDQQKGRQTQTDKDGDKEIR